MSDPARLLSGDADDFEKELLGSWGAEQPGDAGRAGVLAMVGLGVGAGAIAGTAAATKAGVAAGGSIAPKAAAAGTAVLLKWLAAGLVGVATAGATVAYVRHPRSEAPVASVVAAAAPRAAANAPALSLPASPPPPAAPAVAPPPAPAAAAVAEDSPRALHASAPSRHAATMDRASRPADPALGEQVAALDRARHALGEGDAPTALREVGDYEARFPRGALAEEADVLRIESLLAAGDRASAARAGARFLTAHPGSPHAARVRALLGSAPAP